MRDRLALGLLLLAAVELAVWECFLVPLRPHGTAAVLALVGNVVLGRAASGVRQGWGNATGLCWLVTALGLSMGGPLGDVIVPGTGSGVAFLVAGVAGAAGGAGLRGSKGASGATPAGQTRR